MSGANASPSEAQARQHAASRDVRSHQEMSGANASPIGRSHQEMSGANASPIGRSHQEMNDPLYIAVDLGAGSGRIVLGGMSLSELLLEEVHRFQYEPI